MEPDRFDGYRAFDYLDHDRPPLADTYAEVAEPYEVPLDDDERRRYERLVDEHPVVSLHEHAFRFPADMGDLREYVREGCCYTAYEALAASNLDAVFDMHLDGLSGIRTERGWTYDDVVHDVTMRANDIAHSETVDRVGSVEAVRAAAELDRVGLVPALESSTPIENDPDRVETLYGMGVRSLGITYIESNALGTGGGDDFGRDGGLTAFGREAVRRMNDVGMAVSVSHASERTTLDACEVTEVPVLDTHSRPAGAGEDEGRGASDEALRAVADTGGVIGIVASATVPDLETYMEQFEYVRELVGIDHVTFGPDTLYGDHRALLQVLGDRYDVDVPLEIDGHRYVRGLENPTEAWRNIPRWLVREGYSEEEIRKAIGGNTLRVLEETW
ncbi:peptidase M19 [Halobacteriales archaeon SW_7_71_33]|nr:MAG: peptidase M19 [Halobacteriales archaeon SW_7_71_33]